MKHKNFKCTFNPDQSMAEYSLTLGTKCPIHYGVNTFLIAKIKAMRDRKWDDYSQEFMDWFKNFHSERLHIPDWDSYPEWMTPILKKQADTIFGATEAILGAIHSKRRDT